MISLRSPLHPFQITIEIEINKKHVEWYWKNVLLETHSTEHVGRKLIGLINLSNGNVNSVIFFEMEFCS